jgi:putative membrane protein
MREQFLVFISRWFFNTFILWILTIIFGTVSGASDMGSFFLAGFIFSLANSILKPIITILALPAILITLGLFTLVVNVLIVWLSISLTPGLAISFWNAIVAGAALSLINYLISTYSVNNNREGLL